MQLHQKAQSNAQNGESRTEAKDYGASFRWLIVFISVIFVLLIMRFWYIQVVDGDHYKQLAFNNFIKRRPVLAERGQIFDVKMRPVATNRPSYNVILTPAYFTSKTEEESSFLSRMDALASSLALTDTEKQNLIQKIRNTKTADRLLPIPVKNGITRDQLAKVETNSLMFHGVEIIASSKRYYPFNELGAHIIGYVNQINDEELKTYKDYGYRMGDVTGRMGIERRYEPMLRGANGLNASVVNAKGIPQTDPESLALMRDWKDIEPISGKNIVLTIDMDFQRILKHALRDYPTGAIVAVEPGQTKVEFKANCKFQPGKDKNSQPIPGMQKGDIQTFYLDQFDVLNLETAVFGEDPTGSTVTADKNVAVFVGNEATSLPETDPVTCCADHIEHQQYPLGAWGKEYNAVKLKPRGKERDLWRILARTNDTVVTTTPAVTGAESVTLNAGQWFDILTTESFTIHATSPVLVGQFMAGQNDPNDPETGTFTKDSANIGDPAYLIGVPVEQYRTSYKFLTPGKYAEDYITIVAPLDATVKLDGDIISPAEFFTFGENKYKAAYRMVEDGPHSLEASAPVGLFSYGFDHYVSYGYPAGLDLKELFE